MSSVFTKIVNGELPAYKVAETEDYLAFLDINPLAEGHVLVIPKEEVDNLFDLDTKTYIGLQLFAKMVAKGLQETIECERIGVAVIGLEVPHCHIHLIPINSMKDMNFSNPKLKLSEEQLKETAAKISAAIR